MGKIHTFNWFILVNLYGQGIHLLCVIKLNYNLPLRNKAPHKLYYINATSDLEFPFIWMRMGLKVKGKISTLIIQLTIPA